ncbi:MAG: hypothetical protein ABI904_19990 [Chloroflexota bacterium]
MNVNRRLVIALLVFILLLATQGTAQAQSTDVQFFLETGHNVKGIFLQFYKSAKDPQLVYGYPITEQMTSKDGKTVQYFQRARFELTSTQAIQLTALGSLTYQPKNPMTINNPNACQVYPNGVPVCFTFLDFYKANGGPTQFGNPISPFESSDGLIVQYFEGARFEWRADRPADQRVVISDLGRIYFDLLKEDPAQLKPVDQPDATINPVLSLTVRAFVLKAVTLKSGQQTVYVIVQNQIAKPVSNATGKALVKLPDGTLQEFSFTTNASGIAQISFNFQNQKSGELVPIEISVTYQSITGATKTSFRIWF